MSKRKAESEEIVRARIAQWDGQAVPADYSPFLRFLHRSQKKRDLREPEAKRREVKKAMKRRYWCTPWPPHEQGRLERLAGRFTSAEIAQKMGKSKIAVITMASQLDISLKPIDRHARWSGETNVQKEVR